MRPQNVADVVVWDASANNEPESDGAVVPGQAREVCFLMSTKPDPMRYASGRRNESSPYFPLETSNEEACCRPDYIAVCYRRTRPGIRTCCDRTGSHRHGAGHDVGACTQDDEARAQGESPRDAQEGGVIRTRSRSEGLKPCFGRGAAKPRPDKQKPDTRPAQSDASCPRSYEVRRRQADA